MESSLHCALKDWYGPQAGGNCEVLVHGFRIDAVDPDGRLVEIQSGALGPLVPKLRSLLTSHRVRVVKPVPLSKRVVHRSRANGRDLSARRSPKRGEMMDVFDDLVGIVRLFPHPNLQIEVLGVSLDEVRVPRRRWPGYEVVDRRLDQLLGQVIIQHPSHLWQLLPGAWDAIHPFSTRELALFLKRPLAFAQRVAYCLRQSGAVQTVGKRRNHLLYVGIHHEMEAATPAKPAQSRQGADVAAPGVKT